MSEYLNDLRCEIVKVSLHYNQHEHRYPSSVVSVRNMQRDIEAAVEGTGRLFTPLIFIQGISGSRLNGKRSGVLEMNSCAAAESGGGEGNCLKLFIMLKRRLENSLAF